MKNKSFLFLLVISLMLVPITSYAESSNIEKFIFEGEEVKVVHHNSNELTIYENNGSTVTHIRRDNSGHVYVNDRKISEIVPLKDKANIYSNDDTWKYAGVFKYSYNIAGLTPLAVGGILGLVSSSSIIQAAASVAKGIGYFDIVAGIFGSGCFIDDYQYTYYKNIDKQRPDMRIEHSIYLRIEIFNNVITDEYLGGFTTYGGI